jgi:hypothetical protein
MTFFSHRRWLANSLINFPCYEPCAIESSLFSEILWVLLAFMIINNIISVSCFLFHIQFYFSSLFMLINWSNLHFYFLFLLGHKRHLYFLNLYKLIIQWFFLIIIFWDFQLFIWNYFFKLILNFILYFIFIYIIIWKHFEIFFIMTFCLKNFVQSVCLYIVIFFILSIFKWRPHFFFELDVACVQILFSLNWIWLLVL